MRGKSGVGEWRSDGATVGGIQVCHVFFECECVPGCVLPAVIERSSLVDGRHTRSFLTSNALLKRLFTLFFCFSLLVYDVL